MCALKKRTANAMKGKSKIIWLYSQLLNVDPFFVNNLITHFFHKTFCGFLFFNILFIQSNHSFVNSFGTIFVSYLCEFQVNSTALSWQDKNQYSNELRESESFVNHLTWKLELHQFAIYYVIALLRCVPPCF